MSVSAINLTGGGYLEVPHHSAYDFGTGDFTLETWVRLSAPGTLISKKGSEGGPNNGGFLLMVRGDGTIKFATDNGFGFNEVVTGPTPVLDRRWHHVAAVRSGTNLAIIVDGVALPATPQGNIRPPLSLNNTRRLLIGSVDQRQEPFKSCSGTFDDVRIWNIARTAAEIASGMSIQLFDAQEHLVAYFTFEYGLFCDFSPTRNAAFRVGAVSYTTYGAPIREAAFSTAHMLYAGEYETAMRSVSGEAWTSGTPLYVTLNGAVVLGSEVINGATFDGSSLTWPAATGATSSGALNFRLDRTVQPPRAVFDGTIRTGGTTTEVSGVVRDAWARCAILQNNAVGQVLDAGAAVAGTPVMTRNLRLDDSQHFCLTSDGFLVHMHSQLVLEVSADPPGKGDGVRLAVRLNGKPANQRWTMDRTGRIASVADPELFITVSPGDGPGVLILESDSARSMQGWQLLTSYFPIINRANGLCLTRFGTDIVEVAPRNDINPTNQLWYFVAGFIVSAVDGKVLGFPVPEALRLQRLDNDNNQKWTLSNGRLVSSISNMVLDAVASPPRLALAQIDQGRPTQGWTTSSIASASALPRAPTPLRGAVPMTVGDAARIHYLIKIRTANLWFAGTDEEVTCKVVGSAGQFSKALTESLDHSDPFEIGNTDSFLIESADIGELTSIELHRMGVSETPWEMWLVDWVELYDPVRHTTYHHSFGNSEVIWRTAVRFTKTTGGTDRLTASKYPAEGYENWLDHTWVEVAEEVQGTIYFDCAGGHVGEPTTKDIVVGQALLGTAVLMATGYPISSAHPLQTTYGTNDVNGVGTCGLRASGKLNWDGQCHQITNRLLYVAQPRQTLADAGANKPQGYGLSVFLWGPYGVWFNDWVRTIGLDAPAPDVNVQGIYNWIQALPGAKRPEVMEKVLAFQRDWADTQRGRPNGPIVADFVKGLKEVGLADDTIAQLTNLTVAEVQHDEL